MNEEVHGTRKYEVVLSCHINGIRLVVRKDVSRFDFPCSAIDPFKCCTLCL